MPKVTCASDTGSGLGPNPEPPDTIVGKFSPQGSAVPALPSYPCHRQARVQGTTEMEIVTLEISDPGMEEEASACSLGAMRMMPAI